MITRELDPTLANLRREIEAVLGGEIGKYKRPGIGDINAIWVGRNVPDDCKVAVAGPTENFFNALEVNIDDFPEYFLNPKNFGAAAYTECWRVWLSFHDDRQFPRQAIDLLIKNFAIVEGIRHVPASAQNPNQYQVLISHKRTLRR